MGTGLFCAAPSAGRASAAFPSLFSLAMQVFVALWGQCLTKHTLIFGAFAENFWGCGIRGVQSIGISGRLMSFLDFVRYLSSSNTLAQLWSFGTGLALPAHEVGNRHMHRAA